MHGFSLAENWIIGSEFFFHFVDILELNVLKERISDISFITQ